MDFTREQTIAARATAPGSAGQAVLRVSGPDAIDIVGRVFLADDPPGYRAARVASRHRGVIRLRPMRDAVPAAAYCWPTDRCYTGQPMCELRLPGAGPLVEATLAALYSAGAQPARAGEFTLRAFLAGRIDLLQAEAVLGVIDAPDEDHLLASLAQLAGGLSGVIGRLQEQLLTDLADLEAGLDFAEEDLEFVDRNGMRERLGTVESMLERLQRQASDRMHEAPTARVVLAGPPNSGKSTLFNCLLKRDTAIVSGRAGTTRDYLTARVNWNGRDIEILDTPGHEPAADDLMRSAFALRDDAVRRADVIVWCCAADFDPRDQPNIREQTRSLNAECRLLPVTTKSDLLHSRGDGLPLAVSAVTGEGIRQFELAVLSALGRDGRRAQELIGSTAARCADSIRQAREAVSRAGRLVEQRAGDELVAAEMRAAVDEVGRMTGRIHSEDILDRIFSRFCIGK